MMNPHAAWSFMAAFAKMNDVKVIEIDGPYLIDGVSYAGVCFENSIVVVDMRSRDLSFSVETLAHELGHAILQRHRRRPSIDKINVLSLEERNELLDNEIEAWEFADCLLENIGFIRESLKKRIDFDISSYKKMLSLER